MIAIKNIATHARRTGAAAIFALTALVMAGCNVLPDKPVRTNLYDFGPVAVGAAPAPAGGALPTLALAEVESNPRLDSTQLLYRLGYVDGNELASYSQSRWSVPPPQLLRQRLRDALAQRRTVLGPDEAATLARAEGRLPDTLRVTIDEFSHYFDSPQRSEGLVRLRATLIRTQTGGDRVVGQRSFELRRPAPSNDAPGGVKALAAASDAAVAEILAWVDQAR